MQSDAAVNVAFCVPAADKSAARLPSSRPGRVQQIKSAFVVVRRQKRLFGGPNEQIQFLATSSAGNWLLSSARHAAARQTCGEEMIVRIYRVKFKHALHAVLISAGVSTEIQTEFAAAIPVSDESDDQGQSKPKSRAAAECVRCPDMSDQLTENIKALDHNIINIVVTNEKADTVIEPTDKVKNTKIKESIVCGCGGHYVNRNKTRHMKTKRHLDYEGKHILPENQTIIA
ncbi:MAG UNVERIFIED_CONTAM: hypothetical protein LVR18_49360 [Planctomycetaceae bacterium]